MRSLIRFRSGRLELEEHSLTLSDAERDDLSRFGLALSGDGDALRLLTEPEPIPGFDRAFQFDPASRRSFAPAPADGVLLRFMPHRQYQSEAQKAAVRALLTQPPASGLMVSMPTGSGKSLLFQLAMRVGRSRQPGACAIVITPTIALALDHARTLSGMTGLEESRALTGDTPVAESQSVVNAFRRGEVPVLLLSPEKALSPGLIGALAEAARPDSALIGLEARLTHLFVDEAHIVESWGRSFRPDFQRLPALLAELRAVNPAVRAVLLSATLPPAAREVLRASWSFDKPWLEIDAATPRYDHDVVVASYEWPEQRDEALLRLIDRIPRPAIIYTTEVAEAADLFERLQDERGYGRIALFTGNTGATERRRIVEDWAEDRYDLIVATSAFGMGIDKAGVRSVVHACLPESPARWYQEVGRASRDHGQGLAACLFVKGERGSDISQAYGLATSGWLTRDVAEQRWAALVDTASDKRWEDGQQRLTLNLDAAREGLPRRENDYNRGWNMALLTLMQRAGSLQVRAVPAAGDQAGARWDVAILRPGILDSSDAGAWDQVFETREREVQEAKASLRPYIQLMLEPERACLTRSVFELIEPHALAPPCGRCPHCRAASTPSPGTLPSAGLERAWPEPAEPHQCGLPGGLLLLEPRDASFERGFETLIERLAGAGIEQFLLEDDLAGRTAHFVSHYNGLGLVLSTQAVASDTAIAALPTALLLPRDPSLAAFLIERLRAFSIQWPDLPMIVVAEPDRLLGGRRLDQTISRSAPVKESVLDSYATKEVA